jgi:PAS domain-containing protein
MQELTSAAGLSLAEMQHHPTLIINAFDKQHNVLFWNDRCSLHFGIPAEEAIGKKLEDLIPWIKSDERMHFIDRALLGKGMQVLRVPYRLKSGVYDQQVIPVRNDKGEVIAALNMVADT